MEIYINRDGQHHGPYSVEQVNEQLAAGELSVEDLAWYEGAEEWLPLHQLFNVEVEKSPAQEQEIAPEPKPEPEPPAEHQPEPEYHPEPEPAPAPAAVRSVEPPWVPPRRDGMQTPSAAAGHTSRLPMPTRFFSPSPSSAPAPAPARPASLAPVISAEEAQAMARKHLSSGTAIDASATKPIWGLLISAIVLTLGLALTFFAYKEADGLPRATIYVGWGVVFFGGFGFVMALVRYFGD